MFLLMKLESTVLCGLWNIHDKFTTNYPLLRGPNGYYYDYFYALPGR